MSCETPWRQPCQAVLLKPTRRQVLLLGLPPPPWSSCLLLREVLASSSSVKFLPPPPWSTYLLLLACVQKLILVPPFSESCDSNINTTSALHILVTTYTVLRFFLTEYLFLFLTNFLITISSLTRLSTRNPLVILSWQLVRFWSFLNKHPFSSLIAISL